MKEVIGQYAKVILILFVVVPIVLFLLSTGAGSFQGMMPEPTVQYEASDSSDLVGDISKREPPTITVKSVKMKKGQKYKFTANTFVDYVNQDGNKNNTTLTVKKVIDPRGNEVADPEAEFTARKGIYKVKYQVTEVYKSSKRTAVKDASFVCD